MVIFRRGFMDHQEASGFFVTGVLKSGFLTRTRLLALFDYIFSTAFEVNWIHFDPNFRFIISYCQAHAFPRI